MKLCRVFFVSRKSTEKTLLIISESIIYLITMQQTRTFASVAPA